MSKKFRQCKNFLKRIGDREKMTFGDYKKRSAFGAKDKKAEEKELSEGKVYA